MLLLLLVLPYQIPDKVFVNPLGRRKSVFTLPAAIFQNVCLCFLIGDNFFPQESAKKVENAQLFLSHLFQHGFLNANISQNLSYTIDFSTCQ